MKILLNIDSLEVTFNYDGEQCRQKKKHQGLIIIALK